MPTAPPAATVALGPLIAAAELLELDALAERLGAAAQATLSARLAAARAVLGRAAPAGAAVVAALGLEPAARFLLSSTPRRWPQRTNL
ncbi:MAG: hypothetical protein U1F43_00865 [Myxococcota bacterium]